MRLLRFSFKRYLIQPCTSWSPGRSRSPPYNHTCSCRVGWCKSDCRCPAQHIHRCLQVEEQEVERKITGLNLQSAEHFLKHRWPKCGYGVLLRTWFQKSDPLLSPSQVFLSSFRLYPAGQEQLKPTFRSVHWWEQPPFPVKHSFLSVETQIHSHDDHFPNGSSNPRWICSFKPQAIQASRLSLASCYNHIFLAVMLFNFFFFSFSMQLSL